MLIDPLPVGMAEYGVPTMTDVVTFGTRDFGPGRTDRKAIHPTLGTLKLLIAHSESKENKGVLTDRSIIKLSAVKQVAVIGETSASFQVTVAYPRSGFTLAEMRALKDRVIALLSTDSVDSDGAVNLGNGFYDRIVQGEP